MFKYWSLLLSYESWPKSCERRSSGLLAFITTLMGCGETIFVGESTINFHIFLLCFNTKFPIFPIFSILSFLFSYFFEHSWHWTPWQLIPLEKIRSSRDSVRNARESHLIDKAMTVEPHGLNRRDELIIVIHILSIFTFPVFMLYVISASPF